MPKKKVEKPEKKLPSVKKSPESKTAPQPAARGRSKFQAVKKSKGARARSFKKMGFKIGNALKNLPKIGAPKTG